MRNFSTPRTIHPNGRAAPDATRAAGRSVPRAASPAPMRPSSMTAAGMGRMNREISAMSPS